MWNCPPRFSDRPSPHVVDDQAAHHPRRIAHEARVIDEHRAVLAGDGQVGLVQQRGHAESRERAATVELPPCQAMQFGVQRHEQSASVAPCGGTSRSGRGGDHVWHGFLPGRRGPHPMARDLGINVRMHRERTRRAVRRRTGMSMRRLADSGAWHSPRSRSTSRPTFRTAYGRCGRRRCPRIPRHSTPSTADTAVRGAPDARHAEGRTPCRRKVPNRRAEYWCSTPGTRSHGDPWMHRCPVPGARFPVLTRRPSARCRARRGDPAPWRASPRRVRSAREPAPG